jgi:hypothetical protein
LDNTSTRHWQLLSKSFPIHRPSYNSMLYVPHTDMSWNNPSEINVQIITLLMMQCSPSSCYFLTMRSKWSPLHPTPWHSMKPYILWLSLQNRTFKLCHFIASQLKILFNIINPSRRYSLLVLYCHPYSNVIVLLHISGVLCSNLDLQTCYPDWGFCSSLLNLPAALWPWGRLSL